MHDLWPLDGYFNFILIIMPVVCMDKQDHIKAVYNKQVTSSFADEYETKIRARRGRTDLKMNYTFGSFTYAPEKVRH
jgi:hypothetical protein